MPSFECGAPDCEFAISANDPEEIIEYVKRHAAEKHGRDVDADRVRERIEPS